jgi:hypothetical protein
MRFLIPLAALTLLAFQAQAQTATTPAPADQGTSAPAAAAPAPAAPTVTKKAHHQTLQQRFDAANTTHDGKLTKDQAAAANWTYIVKNFDKMDKDKKGYVTVSDIRNYAKTMHAQRHHKTAAPATNG